MFDKKTPEAANGIGNAEENTGLDTGLIQPTREDVAITTGADVSVKEHPEITPQDKARLFTDLEIRINKPAFYDRPEGIVFDDVKRALEADQDYMWSIFWMQETGGEPDIIAVEEDYFVFADCSKESPIGRRNCVYDKEIQDSLTGEDAKNCSGNMMDMARKNGIDPMNYEFYKDLVDQEKCKKGKFDEISYNLLLTPIDIRKPPVDSGIPGQIHIGDCKDGKPRQTHFPVDSCRPDSRGGWRGIKRVRKVAKALI